MRGTEPYSWSATGLPAGLTVSGDGVVAGTPTGPGGAQVTARVTDAANAVATAVLPLSVPTTLPAPCVGQSCALLTPDGATVQVAADRVAGVVRDGSGAVTQLRLTGPAPTPGPVSYTHLTLPTIYSV